MPARWSSDVTCLYRSRFRLYAALAASPEADAALGEVTQMSRAAERPGAAQEVSISAGLSSEETNPRGSVTSAGSAGRSPSHTALTTA